MTTERRRGDEVTRPGVIGGVPDFRGPRRHEEPSYYDIPLIKASEWTWMVPIYFAAGGMAGGAYVLARLADRCGGREYRSLARTGTYVAAVSLLPCPVLLVLDLGDPKRFHHMLRVFKPISPMSVGSWTLTAFSGCVGAAAVVELTGSRSFLARLTRALSDIAGIPLGLMMVTYTGVLLSTTSTPIWTQNPWLPALFSASAFELAAGSVNLAMELGGHPHSRALKSMSKAARLATAATLAGYLISAGRLAQPLTTGKYAPHLWGGAVVGGMILPAALEKVAPESKVARVAAAVLGIAGGFLLKWAVGNAGHPSGKDPEAARISSRR